MEIPLFPLHTVLCPGIVLPLHIFEDRYRAMTRRCLDTRRAVRGRAHPRRPGDRHGQDGDAGRRRGLRRDPPGRPLPGRPIRPARRGDRALRDRIGGRPDRAVPARRGHPARRRGRRRAPCRAPGRGRDPPLRPLPRPHARPRRRDDRGARHPRRDRVAARRRHRPGARPTRDGGPRGRGEHARSRRRTCTSPTTRRSSPTCCPASSRSSCRAARRCSRPRPPWSAWKGWSPCSSASSCS